MAQANSRRSQLEESHSLQQFLRDTEETKNWISEKIKIAGDENYKVGCQHDPPSYLPPQSLTPLLPPQDPTNQEAKLQQHQAFEAELQANKGRIDGVVETTEELIEAGHYAADVIRWAELGAHQ